MAESVASIRDELAASLKKLVDRTEEVFLHIAERFPSLVRESEGSILEAEQLVKEMRVENSESASMEQSVFSRARILIENSADSFQTLYKQDEQVFATLDSILGDLGAVNRYIANIREDSEEMEIISLNAMTVALKAGLAGRAFSYITEELKRLSARTIGLTNNITTKGKELQNVFTAFQHAMHEIQTVQSGLFSTFQQQISESFDQFSTCLNSTAGALSELTGRARELRAPLLAIMQNVQLQDVIRQSVDHVLISLNEIRDLNHDDSDETQLDELSFYTTLPNLCNELLDDISARIKDSHKKFITEIAQVRKLVAKIESDRVDLIRTSLDESNSCSLAHGYETASNVMANLIEKLGASLDQKDKLSSDSNAILEEIKRLEELFASFRSIISRFHAIDIASRIEVAKQEVLQKMVGTIQAMTRLTSKIEDDVGETLKTIKNFIGQTNSVLHTYNDSLHVESTVYSRFRDNFEVLNREIKRSRHRSSTSISNFAMFSTRFFSLLEDTDKELQDLSKLTESINQIKSKLHQIKLRAEDQKERLLEKTGRANWQIENLKLQDIIKRFTIFTHKKTAGALGNFSVEEGAASGEVTFF